MSDVDPATPPPVLFARQPIFDASRRIVAFELLFRPTDGGPIPSPFDGERATSTVLLNAFTQSDLESVSHGKPLYVNFTAETLANELPFCNSQLVIEVLEDTPTDDTIRERLMALKAKGFTLALDDYTLPDAGHPFLALVDIVKLEYPHYDREGFQRIVSLLRHHFPHLRILAEKLENESDLTNCLEAGCDLFQGYCLARPQLVHGKPMTTDRLATLELIAALNQPEVSVQDITAAISRDPSLGVRLLHMVNTAQYQRRGSITSLYHAVTLIGTQRIRSLATLLALAGMQDKPESLQQLALARACLCRALTDHDDDLAEKAFIAGLFSYLEAFFDQPMHVLIGSLPLHPSIAEAVLNHRGPVGTLLDTTIKLENGEWNEIDWERLGALGIDAQSVSAANPSALRELEILQTTAGF
ncbi:EAL and HDOD domain-containing protein [Salinicola aestuarinus]|uniref:EAL and HDOD domain-containing protein n=1 Tax=Salinicola aestuarinus TaxID=1949082 RepID=UPI000DA12580|nr:HDOD domain-containing protein [Salinicola aestuarinus]